MAVELELIPYNPADRITLSRNKQYIPEYYTAEELNHLLDCIKGDEMELLMRMVCFYGMRKSEALRPKWSAINLKNMYSLIRWASTKFRKSPKQTQRVGFEPTHRRPAYSISSATSWTT